MASALMNIVRLARAGVVLSQHGVRFVPQGMKVPLVLHAARILTLPIRLITWPFRIGRPKAQRISDALASLGPSYIKLGQFLATRADVIGPDLADDLRHLQDKLPPFSMAQARQTIEEELGGKLEDHFAEFGPPVAAASIAQVHKAVVIDKDGKKRNVAVKILRPGVERRFKRDLDSYFFVAEQVEYWHPPSRRLKPVAVIENLKRTTELELDLRLEAAAISEMAEKTASDDGFRVPEADWRRTSKRVVTMEWIDGTPISDHAALKAKGFDLKALGLVVLRSFLRHAMRDGFFHADMHQGNLFVDDKARVVAVDFGIMGRLGTMEQRYLAEILHGLITRDYTRASEFHFEAGYVPQHHDVAVFAQALRAIGEPINGLLAEEISMADLLGQLFAYTDVFDMQTRPELILLQKSLVIVEGVARSLDPALNIFTASEPVAKEFMERHYGPMGRLREAGQGASALGKVIAEMPRMMGQAQTAATALSDIATDGMRLDDATIKRLAREQAKANRRNVWLGLLPALLVAGAIGALAAKYLLPLL